MASELCVGDFDCLREYLKHISVDDLEEIDTEMMSNLLPTGCRLPFKLLQRHVEKVNPHHLWRSRKRATPSVFGGCLDLVDRLRHDVQEPFEELLTSIGAPEEVLAVDLTNNGLRDEDLTKVAEMLTKLPNCRYLNLSANKLSSACTCSSVAIGPLSKIIQNSNLFVIDVTWNLCVRAPGNQKLVWIPQDLLNDYEQSELSSPQVISTHRDWYSMGQVFELVWYQDEPNRDKRESQEFFPINAMRPEEILGEQNIVVNHDHSDNKRTYKPVELEGRCCTSKDALPSQDALLNAVSSFDVLVRAVIACGLAKKLPDQGFARSLRINIGAHKYEIDGAVGFLSPTTHAQLLTVCSQFSRG